MDLEEWELLPGNDGFVDIGLKNGLSQYPQEETIQLTSPVTQPRVVPSLGFQSSSSWEPVTDGEKETDQEPVPGVFSSKKSEEITESVDMKIGLPRSKSRVTGGCLTQKDGSLIELDESMETKKDGTESWSETDQDRVPRVFASNETEETIESVDMKLDLASGSFIELDESMEAKKDDGSDERERMEENGEDWEESEGKSTIRKVGFTGVGAICSFGVAFVATIGVIFLGNNQKNLMNQDNNQKLSFQIFSNNKGMKQVAARGVPITRAHISYGGYLNQL